MISSHKILQKIFVASVFVSLSFFVFSTKAFAANRFWVGAANASTNLTSSWSTVSGGASGASVPGTSDVAVFDGGVANNGNTNAKIDVAFSVLGISITSGYTQTITQNAGIAVTIAASGYTQNGGTFAGSSGNISVGGSFNWTGGTFTNSGVTIFTYSVTNSLTCNGTLGGLIRVTSGNSGNTTFTINAGCSVVVDTSVAWVLPYTSTFTNNGTMTVNSGTWTYNNYLYSAGSSTLINNGTITNSGSGWSIGMGINFTNNGTTTYTGSILSMGGSFTQNGSFNLAGITVLFGGTSGVSSSLTCSGNLGGLIRAAYGNQSSNFTINAGCSVVVDTSVAWVLPYTSTFTNNGTMTVNSGTWTMNISLSTGAIFANGGTINHNGSSWVLGSNVSLTNNASGTINGASLTSITVTSGNLTNATSSSMTLGATTLTIGGNFTQNGTADLSNTTVIFYAASGSNVSTLTCSGSLGAVGIRLTSGTGYTGFIISSGCSVIVDTSVAWTVYGYGSSPYYITNNGTMTVNSGTWTINNTANNYVLFTNNGTINVNTTAWNLGGNGNNISLTNSASGTITYAGSVLNITGDFTQSGTFNLSGITVVFNSGQSMQTLTCSGSLGAVGIRMSAVSTYNGFTVSSGCSAIVDTSVPWVSGGYANAAPYTMINNGTLIVNSGTWTINNKNSSIFPITNNGTITHNGSGWILGSSVSLINSASGTITYAGTSLSIGSNFTQSGTFNTAGKNIIFNGVNVNPTFTCTGTFPGNVQVGLSSNSYTFTLAAGCNTFGGDFTTLAGASGILALPVSTTLSVAGNISLGSTGAFGNSTTVLALTGAGKSLTLNGSTVSNISSITYGAANQIFNYVGGTYFATATFGANIASVNLLGGTFSTISTFTGANQIFTGVSTSTLTGNTTFSGTGTAWISLGGNATAGTVTINQNVSLSGNTTVYNLTVNSGKTLDTSPDGGTTIYNLVINGVLTNSGTILLRSSTVTFNDTNLSVTRSYGSLVFGNVILTSADTTGSYTSTFTGGLNLTGNLTIQTNGGASAYTHTWQIASTTSFTLPGSLTIRMTAGSSATPILSTATATTWNMVGANSSLITSLGVTFSPANFNFNGSGTTSVSLAGTWASGTTTVNQSSGAVVLVGDSKFNNLVINSGKVLDVGTVSVNSNGGDVVSGLVGYWKLDESSGSSAADSSGNSQTGTILNAPTRTSSVGSGSSFTNPYAFTLNGTNQAVSIPDSTYLKPQYMTLSVWIKPVDRITNRAIVSKTESGSYNIYIANNIITAQVYINAAYRNISADISNIPTSSWINTAFSYDGNVLNLYINGVLVNSLIYTYGAGITHAAQPLCIGAEPSGGVCSAPYFSGDIDDVRIYNRALSAQEVANVYLNFKSVSTEMATPTLTVNGSFINNAGATGLVVRNGTVVFYNDSSATNPTPTLQFGSISFNNITFSSKDTASVAKITTIVDSFSVSGLFTVSSLNSSSNTRTYSAQSSSVITISGSFSMSKGSSGAVPIFDTNITFNMTGSNQSFVVSGGTFKAALNFNGSGTTLVNTGGGTWSTGTTTINQSSGFVALSSDSSFYNTVINSNAVLDSSPDGGTTSYILTVGGSFINNAGATGLVVRNGTVNLVGAIPIAISTSTIKTGGIVFNNLAIGANHFYASYVTATILTDNITVNGNLAIVMSAAGTPANTFFYQPHTITATTSITISVGGNLSTNYINVNAGSSPGLTFGNSNVNVIMTGDSHSVSLLDSYGTFQFVANLTFSGTGITTVNTGGMRSVYSTTGVILGTTTIAQPSGYVALASNSTFNNLVINSGSILDVSPDGGTTSYDINVNNNFMNHAGATGFVSRAGTANIVLLASGVLTNTVKTGGAIFNNLALGANHNGNLSSGAQISNLADNISVAGNLQIVISTLGSPGNTFFYGTHTISATTPVTISVAGNVNTNYASTTTGSIFTFGNSNVTLAMTGSSKSITLLDTYNIFRIAGNISFNGTGTTLVSVGTTTDIWTSGTTTINQSSGSVVLAGNSTFSNLIINSGNVLDASPDGGLTSYNLFVNGNFTNNAGVNGFVARTGTVSLYRGAGGTYVFTSGGANLYNLAWSNLASCMGSAITNTFADSFSVSGLLSLNSPYNCQTNSWTAPTGIVITVSGSVNIVGNSTATYTVFGNSNVTLNMTGVNKSFVSSQLVLNANVNFNGSGTTTLNTGSGIPVTGTTTMNQSSGSVVLNGNSTFLNLTINSGKVLDASPDAGITSYSATVYGNLLNSAGGTGFVARAGTLTLNHYYAGAISYTTGGATFYNLSFATPAFCLGGSASNTLNDSFSVSGLLSLNSPYNCQTNSWTANTPITITVSGGVNMTGNSSAGATYTTFGNSNVTLNMTGISQSFVISSTVTLAVANLNFNGSGATLVSTSGTWSTGTVTINQSAGSSVNLISSSTLSNLVINSGNVLTATNTNTIYGPSTGLLGYWKMDEIGIAADSSGNGNTGTYVASPTLGVTAPTALTFPSTAVTFNGSSQYTTTSLSSLSSLTLLSVSAWIKTSSSGTINVVSQYQSANRGFELYMVSGKVRIAIYRSASDTTPARRESVNTLNDGNWHHVAGVYDGAAGTLNMYVDGALSNGTLTGSVPSAIYNSTQAIMIGAYNLGGYFNGSIDDVRIYNRVLTAPEITALATGSTASSTATTTPYNLTVNGDLTVNGGTLNASPATTTVGGNFTLTSGVFNHNNGIFAMTGSNKQIVTNRDISFYSFTKSVTAAAYDTLTFNSGYTYTMSGIATLLGNSQTNKLYLNPSLNGTSWNINPTGTRNFNNVAPWYSNNIAPIAISALNSASSTSVVAPHASCQTAVAFCDRGFNINWNFGSGLKAYWKGPAGGNVSGNYWSSTSGGAAGSASISAAYQLFFDSTATTSAVFDASAGGTYAGIYIDPAYTGTITQARTLTLNSQGFVQNGGIFNGNGSAFTTNSFTLGGGVFNAPTTMTDSGTFTVSNGIFSASTTLNVAGSFIDNTTSGTTTLASGMVGYWPLDETSSPSVDASGNGNNGTWVGSPSAISPTPVPPITFSDPYGIILNGTNSIRVSTVSLLSNASAKTVSAWVKPTPGASYTSKFGRIFNHDIVGNQWMFAMSTNGRIGGSPNGGVTYGNTTISNDVASGAWNHVVMTFDGTTMLLYVNGISRGISQSDGTWGFSDSGNVYIGFRTGQQFDGSIDDVRVYNRAISAAEVAALYQGRNSGTFAAGGAFLANSGTVNLTGGSQSVTSQGTTTFNNLTKTISSTATLTFSAGKIFQVLGTTNLSGASGQYLNLRSSQTGTQWKFLPNISASPANTLNILNVQDSNNIATGTNSQLTASGSSIDNGNNLNWLFSIPGTTISWSGTQVATTTIPTSGVMLGGAFTATRTSSGSDLHITGITFKQNGSLSNSYLSNVMLYYNQAAAGSCNSGLVYDGAVMSGGFGPATYTATGKYSFATSTGEITATSIPVSYGTTTCLYLRYDLTGSQSIALVGQSIDLVISNPLTDLLLDSGNATPSSIIDIQGANRATTIDGNSLGLGNVLSINTTDTATNPTIFYVQNSALWMRQGAGTAVRLTPTTVTATGFSFVKSAPSSNTQVVKITLNINEVDPKNAQRTAYAKTFSFTATIRVSSN